MADKVIIPPPATLPKDILTVKFLTPRHFLYYGQALSVSSSNTDGKFDILPLHANFITLIEDQPIIIQKIDHQKIEFRVHQAVVFTSQNEVSIYAEPLVG